MSDLVENAEDRFSHNEAHMSLVTTKPKSDTNHTVQLQKMARSLNILIQEEERLSYLCSENKGTDQLQG